MGRKDRIAVGLTSRRNKTFTSRTCSTKGTRSGDINFHDINNHQWPRPTSKGTTTNTPNAGIRVFSNNRTELISNKVYTNGAIIQPLCTNSEKISAVPQIRSGEVREPICDHSISLDAPEFWYNPHVAKFKGKNNLGHRTHKKNIAPQYRHRTMVSDDAPDWFKNKNVLNYNSKTSVHSHFEKLMVGKTVVLEPTPLRPMRSRRNRLHEYQVKSS
mmetsp:Transcript_18302/g.26612  ORF Transcript_18302/g.26612 Transcript_18302/m.26612 type:complete len:215 (-) Transcript_18302:90-734(-)